MSDGLPPPSYDETQRINLASPSSAIRANYTAEVPANATGPVILEEYKDNTNATNGAAADTAARTNDIPSTGTVTEMTVIRPADAPSTAVPPTEAQAQTQAPISNGTGTAPTDAEHKSSRDGDPVAAATTTSVLEKIDEVLAPAAMTGETHTEKVTAPTQSTVAAQSAAANGSTSPASSASAPGSSVVWQALAPHELAERAKTNLNLENLRQSVGLTSEEAQLRHERDGPNILTPPPEQWEIIKYLHHFLDPFMLLLILSAVLSFIAYSLDETQKINEYIGIVLFVVVFISSTFAYIQSGKASAVMKAFKNMMPRQCHVIRDGKLTDLPASSLVVGDVVRIGTGDQCPADLRLIYCNDLKVELSSLTGESLPVLCTTESKEKKPEEAKNLVWNSAQCIEGEAIGVVFAIGDFTLIGRIAKLASDTTTVDTTLQKEVKGFVKKLTIFSLIMGIIFFCIGLGRDAPIIAAFINGFIVVMIANVPEGLPVTVVTILTITGQRLAALNVFVKQLASVETLGSATVIASDKTGTLTQNKMSVSRLWFDLVPMTLETVYRDLGPSTLSYHPAQIQQQRFGATPTLRALELICAVNSRTRFTDHRDLTPDEAQQIEEAQSLKSIDPQMTLRSAKAAFPTYLGSINNDMTINSAKMKVMSSLNAVRDDSKREVVGDASEVALFNFIRNRQSLELVRYHHPLVFEVPFNSRNKYALTINKPFNIRGNKDFRRILSMKGAPEIVLTRCNRWMNRGKIQPIDEEFKANFTQAYETFGGYGERVLGFAQLELDETQYPPDMDTKYSQKEENYPTTDLVFIGLISLVDPPKETVPGAIAMCRSAGVRVVMVTGDHPLTAAAIARQVGIITTNTRDELAKLRGVPESEIPEDEVNAVVVRGSDLDSFKIEDWDRVLTKHEVVFARTTPAQKLQIVENLQRLKNIVAVTGDGVNDCVAEDTPVMLADGRSIKLARDVVQGDRLLGTGGRTAVVTSVPFTRPAEVMYRITAASGADFVVTPRHLVTLAWRRRTTVHLKRISNKNDQHRQVVVKMWRSDTWQPEYQAFRFRTADQSEVALNESSKNVVYRSYEEALAAYSQWLVINKQVGGCVKVIKQDDDGCIIATCYADAGGSQAISSTKFRWVIPGRAWTPEPIVVNTEEDARRFAWDWYHSVFGDELLPEEDADDDVELPDANKENASEVVNGPSPKGPKADPFCSEKQNTVLPATQPALYKHWSISAQRAWQPLQSGDLFEVRASELADPQLFQQFTAPVGEKTPRVHFVLESLQSASVTSAKVNVKSIVHDPLVTTCTGWQVDGDGRFVLGNGILTHNSPALKKADIGVAMGISGSDVARDAGDVILMDDDFSSIVVGIREGRTIFDNLTKSIAYTVTHMVPEVIPVLMNLAFGFPLGLNAILILAIDIGTELAPAISLAYEKAESDVMSRPPRNSEVDHLVTLKTVTYWYFMAGAWETLCCFLAFFLVFNWYGISPHALAFSDSYFQTQHDNTDDYYFCPSGWQKSGSSFTCPHNVPSSLSYTWDSSSSHPITESSGHYPCPGPTCGYPPAAQNEILAQAQAAYWVTLCGAQVFHIWMCKTRVLSIFQHGWLGNMNMNYGVILEIGIILIIIFVPQLHSFFNDDVYPGLIWLVVPLAWLGLFLINEPRKWAIRNIKGNRIVNFLAW